jgi:hypothetical protein
MIRRALARSGDRSGDDRGASLVELLVASAILAIVLPLAGSLLITALTSQRDVTSLTAASSDAQTVVTSVETGVRNASAIRRTTYPAPDGGAPDELLVVRTRAGQLDADDWSCQAWFYDAGDHTVLTTRTPGSGHPPAITAPTDGDVTGWVELARGVAPAPRTTPVPTPTPSPTTTGPLQLFTVTTKGVEIGLSVSAGSRKPVALTTSISKRPQGETESDPCF